jgi:hypothetical protein
MALVAFDSSVMFKLFVIHDLREWYTNELIRAMDLKVIRRQDEMREQVLASFRKHFDSGDVTKEWFIYSEHREENLNSGPAVSSTSD